MKSMRAKVFRRGDGALMRRERDGRFTVLARPTGIRSVAEPENMVIRATGEDALPSAAHE